MGYLERKQHRIGRRSPLKLVLAAAAILGALGGCSWPGSGSSGSAGGSAAPEVSQGPATPGPVAATAEDQKVTLSWPAVSDATVYHVYWSVFAGVTKSNGISATTAENTFRHTALTNSTTYYYVVSAENALGESVPSSQVSATPLGVTAPTPLNLTLVPNSGQITISWNSSAGADTYNLYWSLLPAVRGSPILGLINPFYTQTGLNNGTTYYYQVTAVNAGGESAPTSQQSAVPGYPIPGAPTGLNLSSTSTTIRVNWNGVVGATGYNVYGAIATGVTPTAANKLNPQGPVFPSFTETGLTLNQTRHYVVTALNALGESPPSLEQGYTTGKNPDRLYVQDGFSAMVFSTINPVNGALGLTGLGFQPFVFPYRLGNMVADAQGRFIFGTLQDLFDRDTSLLDGFQVDSITGALGQLPYSVSPQAAVTGLAVDHSGKFLFVAEGPLGGITSYLVSPPSGALLLVSGSPFVTSGSAPFALAPSPTANYLFGLTGDAAGGLHAVLAFSYDASGALTLAGKFDLASAGNGGNALAVDGSGKYLFVVDQYPNTGPNIARLSTFSITPGTGALTPVGSPFDLNLNLAGALGYRLVCDPAGKFVYLSTVPGPSASANQSTMLVYGFTINATSGALTAITAVNPFIPFPLEAGRLLSVGPMLMDPSGQFLYFSDNQQSVAGFKVNVTDSPGALTAVPGSPTLMSTGSAVYSSQANLRMVMVPGQ